MESCFPPSHQVSQTSHLACPGGEMLFCLLLLIGIFSLGSSTCGRPSPSGSVIFLDTVKDVFTQGETVEYKCRPGYRRALLELSVRCRRDGSWTVPHGCIPRNCPTVEDLDHGIVGYSDNGTAFGAEITFQCNDGYHLVGANRSYCVLVNNNLVGWSEPSPICVEIFCRPPSTIDNGSYKPSKEVYSHLEFVEYSCRETNNVPLSLVGDGLRVCNKGEWTGSDPVCKMVICPYPQIPWGYVTASIKKAYVLGDRVQVACRPGYVLSGDDFGSVCASNSEWDPPLPRCVREDLQPSEAYPTTESPPPTPVTQGEGDQGSDGQTPSPHDPVGTPGTTPATTVAGSDTGSTIPPPTEPIIPDPHVTHVRNIVIVVGVFTVALALLVCICFTVIK